MRYGGNRIAHGNYVRCRTLIQRLPRSHNDGVRILPARKSHPFGRLGTTARREWGVVWGGRSCIYRVGSPLSTAATTVTAQACSSWQRVRHGTESGCCCFPFLRVDCFPILHDRETRNDMSCLEGPCIRLHCDLGGLYRLPHLPLFSSPAPAITTCRLTVSVMIHLVPP